MPRLLVPLLAALLGLALLPAPAAAQSLCDPYGQRLGASGIAAIREKLVLLTPLELAPAAKSVSIEEEDSDREFAPYVIAGPGGESPAIMIPAGFRRLQCRLVLRGYYRDTGRLDRGVADVTRMRACMTRARDRDENPGRVAARCLASVADALIAQAESGPGGPPDADTAKLLRHLVDSAFLQCMLHEFAHIRRGHFDGRGAQDSLGEAEADADSLLQIVTSEYESMGAVWTYTGLSLADPHLPSLKGPHGRPDCRASIADDVRSLLTNLADDSYAWVIEPPAAYLERRSESRGSRADRLLEPSRARGCPSGETRQMLALRDDLEQLTALLDRLALANSKLGQAVDSILGLSLATEEARTLRMSLLSLALRQWMQKDDSKTSRAAQLAAIGRVQRHGRPRDTTSEDFARLEASAAIVAHQLEPSGASIDAMDAALRPRLEKALDHHPALGVAHLELGMLAYRQGRCEEGRRHLARVEALAENPELAREYIEPLLAKERARGCDGARDYARAYLSERRRR